MNYKVSRKSLQNNSEAITNKHDQELPKKRWKKKDRKLLMIWHWDNSIIMEYHKIIKLFDNAPNQPSKFKKKH